MTAVCEFPLSAVVGPGVNQDARVEVKLRHLQAPVKQGQTVGEAQLVVGGKVARTSALVAKEAVAKSLFVVAFGWGARGAGALVVAALLIRVSAKTIRTYRRRRRRPFPQGGRPGRR